MNEIKLSVEKSEEQATNIYMIGAFAKLLNIEYCREVSRKMMDQASMQEAMAVLNPSHSQRKNDVLRKKGKALNILCDYVDCLKEIDDINISIEEEAEIREKINSLFL